MFSKMSVKKSRCEAAFFMSKKFFFKKDVTFAVKNVL